jgi:putative transposase
MLIRKAYKFRLAPNQEQSLLLAQGAGCVRLVWNKALALQKEKLEKKEKVLSYNDIAGLLTEWKKTEDLAFLKSAHSQPLQQTLKDLDRALKDGFSKSKGMPKFKKKNISCDGLKFPQGFKFEGRRLFIPKIGLVKTYQGRPVEGVMKNLTVRKEAGLWYASIQVEQEIKEKIHEKIECMVGIDVGVKRFATLSNGHVIEPISVYRKYEDKLAKTSRRFSRKQKGSRNKDKERRKLQDLHEKVRRIRHDFLHKATHWIAKNHGTVVLEDLQISNMSRSAKGTLEEPGRCVKQKAGLNKSILDQGWFEFKRQLQYKLEWSGGTLHAVPPQYTSQTCSECGHVSPNNRKSQSEFCCESCRYIANADENAAKNIEHKALGCRVMACGSNLNERSSKQEPGRKRKVQKTISTPLSLEIPF